MRCSDALFGQVCGSLHLLNRLGFVLMNFIKGTESVSYTIGKTCGFLFSFLLFFSMLFFILTRFKIVSWNYFYYIAIVFGVYLLFKLIKRLFAK